MVVPEIFIVVASFPPVTGADEPDDPVRPVGVAHEKDAGNGFILIGDVQLREDEGQALVGANSG